VTAERQTRGFLFADLREYAQFADQHGDDAARELLHAYRDVVRGVIQRHRGAEIRTEGDSFYVVFSSIGEAVIAGLEIQEEAEAARTAGSTRPIRVGIGIHAGETLDGEDGIVSSAVNIAARVCSLAKPGQLLVTETVRALTRGYLPVGFAPAGQRRLKGIRDPVTLFEVSRRAAADSRPRRMPHAVAIGGAFAAAVVVLAIVAAAMAIDGWLTTARDASPTPSAEVATSASPSAIAASASPSPLIGPDDEYPNASEERLLANLDEPQRELCTRASAADGPIFTVPDTSAGGGQSQRVPIPYRGAIDCDLGGFSAPDRLLYWDIRATLGGNPYLPTGDASGLVFQQAGRVGASPGQCRDGVTAIESWSFGGASGDLVCYATSTGDAVLLWSRDESPLLGEAVRDDSDMAALLAWWQDVARFHD
jgi:class 3 adenylate cyclase